MTGIGITTYNRPEYFKQCIEHLIKNVRSVDAVFVYNDGSDEKFTKEYLKIYSEIARNTVSFKPPTANPLVLEEDFLPFQIIIMHPEENRGVAGAKNVLLQAFLYAQDYDHIFLLEDDILILDDKAVTEYIRIGEEYGFEHMMFAHHGPANAMGPFWQDKDVGYYPNCVGAWAYYTKECLERLRFLDEQEGYPYPGLFDEHFHNAWEHVEHTFRIANAGMTALFGGFVDCIHSKEWIKEIEGSIEESAIRNTKGWTDGQIKGMKYWTKKNHGEPPPIKMAEIKVEGQATP